MTEILSVVEKILSFLKEGEAAGIVNLVKELPFDKILSAFTSIFETISKLG